MVGCHVQSDNIQVYGNNDESHDNENPDKDVFDFGKKKVLDSLLSWLNQFLSESRVRLTSLEDDLKVCDTYYVSNSR